MSQLSKLTGRSTLARRRRSATATPLPSRPAGRRLAVVAALAAGLALVSACGGGSSATPAPGGSSSPASLLGPVAKASGAPVRIGLITDGASPSADLRVQNRVADATVKYLNEHRSGIAGRPISLTVCETQGDPAKATDCGNRMVEDGVAAVLIGTSGVGPDAWRPLGAAHIPVMMYGSSDPSLLTSPTTFVLADPTFSVIDMPIQVAKKNSLKKVTAVVIDVPAALHSAQDIAPGLFKAAGVGYELVRVAPGTADMTPQMQQVAKNGSDGVFIIGNDSFCISAMNGLRAVGFTGTISAISQCVTDATRKAVPGSVLKGMVVSATSPVGPDSPSTRLYKQVVDTYGTDIDLSSQDAMIMFSITAGFQASLAGLTGDVTPQTIAAAIRSMKETELPGGGGLKFRCNGKAEPSLVSVCLRGGLTTTLDAKGDPAAYQVLGNTTVAG